MLTPKSLTKIMPGVPQAHADEYASRLNEAMLAGDILTKRRAAFFLAQLAHESADLRFMEELASGEEYEGRRDLGNIHKGDGPRFKGRGPIQLTGRNNYRSAGKALGLPLVGHPELAATPDVAFRIAVLFWTRHNLNDVADKGDFERVTRTINGGLNGQRDRLQRLARILAVRPGRSYLPGTLAQRTRRRLLKR